jgi:hypothetical protein
MSFATTFTAVVAGEYLGLGEKPITARVGTGPNAALLILRSTEGRGLIEQERMSPDPGVLHPRILSSRFSLALRPSS